MDLRTGGAFRLGMRMPDGVDIFAAAVHGGVDVHTTMILIAIDGKTTRAVYQIFSCESDATRGANAGWTMDLNQLA